MRGRCFAAACTNTGRLKGELWSAVMGVAGGAAREGSCIATLMMATRDLSVNVVPMPNAAEFVRGGVTLTRQETPGVLAPLCIDANNGKIRKGWESKLHKYVCFSSVHQCKQWKIRKGWERKIHKYVFCSLCINANKWTIRKVEKAKHIHIFAVSAIC